jgi:hypothetical protein
MLHIFWGRNQACITCYIWANRGWNHPCITHYCFYHTQRDSKSDWKFASVQRTVSQRNHLPYHMSNYVTYFTSFSVVILGNILIYCMHQCSWSSLFGTSRSLYKLVQAKQVDKLQVDKLCTEFWKVHIFQFANPSSIYFRKFCTSLQDILTIFQHLRTIFIWKYILYKKV